MSTDGRFFDLPDRHQSAIFAPSLHEAIADDAELLAFDAVVEQLDFSALEAAYSRVGHPAFEPRVMFKILVYGYMLGLRSSRQLDRACRRDDAFRFLAHGLRPDFRTLCRFRRRHQADFDGLFRQTVQLCRQAGLVSLGHVAIDGTKMRANCSKDALGQALAAWREALAEAEAADADLPADAPDAEAARFMKSGADKVPAYNAQLAVDADHQVIVAQEVRTEPVDQGLLAPVAQQVQDNCGQVPENLSADGGYLTNRDVECVAASGTQLHVPARIRGATDLQWVEAEGAYRCPAGRWLRPCRVRKGQQIYRTNRCRGCPRAGTCGVSGKTREVHIPLTDTPRGRLEQRMSSPAGQAVYAARKQIVEPVFGRFKHNLGMRRFLLRGRHGAQSEWSLLCTGHNLKKLIQAVGSAVGDGPGSVPQRLLGLVLRALPALNQLLRPRRPLPAPTGC